MEEHEIPINIYTHDLLGMEKSGWHRADHPNEEFSEPTPLSSKQKYITILFCLGFLCFVALGVWTIQRKVFPTNMEEVNNQVFSPFEAFPIEVNKESITFGFEKTQLLFPIYSNYYEEPYWRWGAKVAFSEIDEEQARKIDRHEKSWNEIVPPPNWKSLSHTQPLIVYHHYGCANGLLYYSNR